jgi:hypothetical protein
MRDERPPISPSGWSALPVSSGSPGAAGLLHDGRHVVLQDVALLGKTLRGFLNLLQVPDFE